MKSKIIKIFSENNKYQHAEVLKRNRVKRQKFREFLVEGVRQIDQLVKSDWKINAFLYSDLSSDWAKKIIKNSKAEEHWELSRDLIRKLSDKEETSEIIAIVEMPEDDLSKIKVDSNLLVLVLDMPASPGNIGTIIRTSDALKVDGIIITGHAADLYDPRTIRASLGTIFSTKVIRLDSYKEVLSWSKSLKLNNVQVIGTSVKTSKDISSIDFSKPTILLVGNETKGLSFNYKEMCDDIVKIKISGKASSLNVSCASAIVLYEVDRQRNLVSD